MKAVQMELGHVTSCHVMWQFTSTYAISYWWSIETEHLFTAVSEILGVLGSRPWPFRITWHHRSCDHMISQVVISYRYYTVYCNEVSSTILEIMGPKYIVLMTLTCPGHMTSSVTW